ncbi:hypothetical protein QTP81_14435 [Alteromonas sp. ASW11-36]|uniref:Uncharacterized protein n=1 Tax=Alteromonas arenosi TaxID=3055817 RepID=A0ABT7T1W2_9ALTE|nr:hypothetical protein [Alteromonas sp. ASW11-36]MDM7861797.1 hypothetical protein [Alteromonas sp. ASW11-36]
MTLSRRWQDKYASYQLTVHDKFIESLIIGAIGDDITARFRKDIHELALQYGGRPFGYFADLSQSEGYTGIAEKEIIKAYQICLQCGCVIDAMIVSSPLVKSQMQRVSDILDIDIPLNVRLFDNRDDAVAFVEKIVDKQIAAL